MRKRNFALIGQKFNHFTILELLPKGRVLAQCDCGNYTTTDQYKIVHGTTKSCGKGIHNKFFKDLSGLIFGFWTVIRFEGRIKSKTRWICQCICGNIVSVNANSLLSGTSKSCGCKSGFLQSLLTTKKDFYSLKRGIYNMYISNAKNREIEFNLSFEDFLEFIDKDCVYCGQPPFAIFSRPNISTEQKLYYNGIDRVNSSQGYFLENCVPCCEICNRAKNDMPYEEFIIWINNLVKFKS